MAGHLYNPEVEFDEDEESLNELFKALSSLPRPASGEDSEESSMDSATPGAGDERRSSLDSEGSSAGDDARGSTMDNTSPGGSFLYETGCDSVVGNNIRSRGSRNRSTARGRGRQLDTIHTPGRSSGRGEETQESNSEEACGLSPSRGRSGVFRYFAGRGDSFRSRGVVMRGRGDMRGGGFRTRGAVSHGSEDGSRGEGHGSRGQGQGSRGQGQGYRGQGQGYCGRGQRFRGRGEGWRGRGRNNSRRGNFMEFGHVVYGPARSDERISALMYKYSLLYIPALIASNADEPPPMVNNGDQVNGDEADTLNQNQLHPHREDEDDNII